VLKNGEANRPKSTEIVKVNYFGTLIDETKFDSSYSHNKFANSWLNQGIKG
jgi:FKBP-type peptidyl-prolyl cis-trans isomerase